MPDRKGGKDFFMIVNNKDLGSGLAINALDDIPTPREDHSFWSLKNAGSFQDRLLYIYRTGCIPGNGKFPGRKEIPDMPSRRPCRKHTDPPPSESAPD